MIRSGGESIHPDTVEAVLQTAPGVEDCSVIGLPDERWGQIVVGCIVGESDVAALDAHVRASRLPGFMRPKYYYFCTEIPRIPATAICCAGCCAMRPRKPKMPVRRAGRRPEQTS